MTDAHEQLTAVLSEGVRRQKRGTWVFLITMVLTIVTAAVLVVAAKRTSSQVLDLRNERAAIVEEMRGYQTEAARARNELDTVKAQKATIDALKDSANAELETLKTNIDKSKQELIAEKHKLTADKKALTQSVKLYEQERTSIRTSVAKLSKTTPTGEKLTASLPLAAVAVPKAEAKKHPELRTPSGDPIYDFKCRLEVPRDRQAEIARVVYRFDHHSFAQKDMASSDSASDFEVGYRGWGALSEVVITIEKRSGEKEVMPFSMREALGWN